VKELLKNMAKTQKRHIGDIGEEIVCRYLRNRGYSIVERNYWKPWGEIDIIARNGSTVSFIEVKSVSRELSGRGLSRGTVRPEENMHPGKVKRLHRTIQTYLGDSYASEGIEWRLDLACVYLDFKTLQAKVEMLENISI